jgi:ParB family chromosome partitioning protein
MYRSTCNQAKVQAHVTQIIAAKPESVQISKAYGTQKEGSHVLPRNKYTAIRNDQPKSKVEAKRPEYKMCKINTEAIITESADLGTLHNLCANPSCPVHHPRQQTNGKDENRKAEQEKQWKEQAIASTTATTNGTLMPMASPTCSATVQGCDSGKNDDQPGGIPSEQTLFIALLLVPA